MVPRSPSRPVFHATAPESTCPAHDAPRLQFAIAPLRLADPFADEPPVRVEALHAMKYCERLFYFQEVEQTSVALPDVYDGRRLHDDVVSEDDVTPEKRSFQVESEVWGLIGKVDAVRKRDGQWIAYEHKKGRCRRKSVNSPAPWPSDRIQVILHGFRL